MQERILRCRISKGMFSDECVVELQLSRGREKAYVVDVSNVLHVDPTGGGELRVLVTTKTGRTVAMLPTTRRDLVPVTENDLVPV